MNLPLEITFRHMERSEALAADIEQHAAQLEKFADKITRCHVVVESPHQHKHQGQLYHISLDIIVHGHEITVSRSHDMHHAHEDPYVAIRDAFNAAKHQLQTVIDKQRGNIKNHR